MEESSISQRHVAVIGAGILGVSTAVWLQRAGLRVTLIDRKGSGEGTSFGNGGVLASAAVVPVTVPGLLRKVPRMLLDPDQPLFMRWTYLPRALPWLTRYLRHANATDTARIARALAAIVSDSLAEHQALAEGTQAAKWIVPSDYLYAFANREAFRADDFGWNLRREHGHHWEELDEQEFREAFPMFSDSLQFGVRLPDHGLIADPGQYVKDLARHVEGQGGNLVIGNVDEIEVKRGAVRGVAVDGQTIDCDAAVLAAGVWSGPLVRNLGLHVPLESERGYHIDLWDAKGGPTLPVMFAGAKFVATPMKGRLRLAGIVEIGGLDAPPSKAPFKLLKRQARLAFPKLTFSHASEWMGHRPAPADSIPLIGSIPGAQGAYAGFGHHHIGLTAGPRTGRLLAQLISGAKPNIDLTPYSPARYERIGRAERQ